MFYKIRKLGEILYFLLCHRWTFRHRPLAPPVFIVGCGHSGTSLMLRLLGAHSQIHGIPRETGIAAGTVSRLRRESRRLDCLTARAGKRRWAEKTPKHILHIEAILEAFPRARIIMMLRDGRDVAYSLYRRTGNLEESIDRWLFNLKVGRSWWGHASVHVVRYESLIVDFEATMRGVFEFIGEEFEEEVKQFHEKPTGTGALRADRPTSVSGENHISYRIWQVNQPLFDGRGKWREFSTQELDLVLGRAGAELAELGYRSE